MYQLICIYITNMYLLRWSRKYFVLECIVLKILEQYCSRCPRTCTRGEDQISMNMHRRDRARKRTGNSIKPRKSQHDTEHLGESLHKSARSLEMSKYLKETRSIIHNLLSFSAGIVHFPLLYISAHVTVGFERTAFVFKC